MRYPRIALSLFLLFCVAAFAGADDSIPMNYYRAFRDIKDIRAEKVAA